MFKNLNIDALNAIGTEPQAGGSPSGQSSAEPLTEGELALPSKPAPGSYAARYDVPYKAEVANFWKCIQSPTQIVGIAAASKADAQRIRTKHYRARQQLHGNDVDLFNRVVVTIEQRQGQWLCILKHHAPYVIIELEK